MNMQHLNKWDSCDSMRVPASNQKGFTLFEVILVVFILVIAVAPMINAFGPSLFATAGEETTIVSANYARQTLNRVAALDFKTLDSLVQNGQSNPVNLDTLFGAGQESFVFKGTTCVPKVVIADASGGAGGLLEITLTLNQVTLKTLKAGC
jgi:prepilin-type N-terminal cleavage/methylation domain-containing protein